MEKTSTGLNPNVAGLLCYVLGWVSGVIFILIEKENKFVRFHAIQSVYVFGPLTIAGIVLARIPFIGFVAGLFIWLLGLILWVVLKDFSIRASEDLNKRILKLNNVVTRLTAVTVIFMLPTLIASHFGMNFQFMPELHQP